MRPRRLTMCALGPFAGREVLDFDDLQGREFFLIHGPTGAGKTTVLDAITLALYGVASGDERTAADMRSHHAVLEEPTEVSFDFDLGGKSYRVWRRPQQSRLKLRGAGSTVQPAEATLRRLPFAGAPDGESSVVATGWAAVTGEVVRILGFEATQFKQVVILPQGQFRQLLVAETKDREVILEALFGTELYRRLQERLREQALELERETRQVADERARVLGEANVADFDGLERQLEDLAAEFVVADKEVALRGAEDAAMRRVQAEARQIHDRLAEAGAAAEALNVLVERAHEMATRRETVARGRRALAVMPAVSMCAQRREEYERAAAGAEEARRQLDVADEAVEATEERLAKQREREAEREAFDNRRRDLESLGPRVDALQRAEAAARNGEEQVARATELLAAARARESAARETVTDLTERRIGLLAAAARADGLEHAAVEAAEAVQRARELVDARVRLTDASHALERRATDLSVSERDRAARRARLAAAHALFVSQQAAVLAKELTPGVPCPVCGATDHPAPASTTASPPDRDDLDRLQREVEESEAALDRLQTESRGQRDLVAELAAAVGATERMLGALAGAPLESLEADERAARSAAAAAAAAKRELAEVDEELVTALGEQGEAELERCRTEEAAGAAREAAARGRTAADSCAREVPEEYRDPQVLERATAAARQAVADLAAAFAAAEQAAREASASQTSVRATLEAGIGRRQDAAQALAAAESTVAAQLAQAGFDSEPDALDAACDDDLLARFEDDVRAYDQAVHAARDRSGRALAEVAGLSEPDLDAIEVRAVATSEAARAAIERRAELRHKLDAATVRRNDLRQLEVRYAALERRFAVVGRLAEVATGKNEPKISFQRFVLAALFDDVAVAASERLAVMSNGRYRLERAGVATDRRRAAGLDLEGYDAYTGVSRSVSTLSGGESFLASLSLALGLADVVQTYSGGVFLETIFVDEGFGTLDPESLDLALRALVDLQRGGRLVGIISHVPELRERIDARLEVSAGRNGSTLGFVVG